MFSFLDAAQTKYQVKIKQDMNKDLEKPNLNKKFTHLVAIVFFLHSFYYSTFSSFLFFLLTLSLSAVK